MQRKIEPIELGATLFIPANHKNLKSILTRERLSNLRSLVIDTEDGLHVRDFEDAISQIKDVLIEYKQSNLYVFIRPKNTEVLTELLNMHNIDKIDGFILAKFSLDNMQEYLELLNPFDFYIMPSIEGEELFDINKLRLIRDRIEYFRDKILLIRFGGEDMLRQLGLRRNKEISLYDMIAPSQVIANILNIFKIARYQVSAPVYPFYSDLDGYTKEIKRDLIEGFITKTIIHPSQIEPLEEIYSVSQDEYAIASKILHKDNAIFADNGSMVEINTQSPWAKNILQRVKFYTLK